MSAARMTMLLALALTGCPKPEPLPVGPAPATPSVDASTPSPRARPVVPTTLTFIDDFNFDKDLELEGVPFGGISALGWDLPRQRLIALSDAHKGHAPSRMYEISVRLDDELTVEVSKMHRLGGALDAGGLDPEGLALSADGRWVVSTEGDGEVTPRIGPALFVIAPTGAVVSEHALPAKWQPTPSGPVTHGVHHNKGIEGLTVSPSGETFFAVAELPLAQDGPQGDFEVGGRLRLMRLDAGLNVVAEHVYLTDPVPRLATDNVQRAVNGVSALCALDERRVLVMERATVRANDVFQNSIRIYEVDVTGEPDVSVIAALDGTQPGMGKTLVLDLSSVVSQFAEGYRSLDNFEGMATGPTLPDGRRTLFMVSDDNFKASQRTALLAFSLETGNLQ